MIGYGLFKIGPLLKIVYCRFGDMKEYCFQCFHIL